MDVARILLTNPDRLVATDIADHALAALRASKVREVVVLGRRGPAQAAFTNAELQEFGQLDDVRVIVDPAYLELDEHSAAALAGDKIAAKNVEILREYAARASWAGERRIYLCFLVSPVEIIGENGRVAAVRIEHNRLTPDDRGGLRAAGAGVFETFDAGMILRSVGFRSEPLSGVSFDQSSCTIANVAGRVVREIGGDPVGGEYVVGWAKRGPSGVIGTNKPDSAATVAAMIADLPSLPGIADENRNLSLIVGLLQQRRPDYVTYANWKTLDAYELKRGAEQGRPRVKVTRVPNMLRVIEQGQSIGGTARYDQ